MRPALACVVAAVLMARGCAADELVVSMFNYFAAVKADESAWLDFDQLSEGRRVSVTFHMWMLSSNLWTSELRQSWRGSGRRVPRLQVEFNIPSCPTDDGNPFGWIGEISQRISRKPPDGLRVLLSENFESDDPPRGLPYLCPFNPSSATTCADMPLPKGLAPFTVILRRQGERTDDQAVLFDDDCVTSTAPLRVRFECIPVPDVSGSPPPGGLLPAMEEDLCSGGRVFVRRVEDGEPLGAMGGCRFDDVGELVCVNGTKPSVVLDCGPGCFDCSPSCGAPVVPSGTPTPAEPSASPTRGEPSASAAAAAASAAASGSALPTVPPSSSVTPSPSVPPSSSVAPSPTSTASASPSRSAAPSTIVVPTGAMLGFVLSLPAAYVSSPPGS